MACPNQLGRPSSHGTKRGRAGQSLETTWQVIHDTLERWTPADLEEVFPPTLPGEESFTRQFVIWHLIEHDLHHGGELAIVLGIHHLAAPRI